MIKLMISTAVSVLAFAATTNMANADPKDSGKAQDSAMAAPAPLATTSVAKRYCVKDDITGTRIPHTVCKTLKEWKAEGFDPLNP